MKLSDDLKAALLAHTRWCAPEEACGLLAVDSEGRLQFFYPITNRDASPVSFTLEPREMLRAADHAEGMGWELGGIMHSHPDGKAYPSAIDVRRSPAESWVHVIVGQRGLGVYRIVAGQVTTLLRCADGGLTR